MQRINIEGIKNDPWFRRNYVSVRQGDEEEVSLDDVNAVFNDIEVCKNLYCNLASNSDSTLCSNTYQHYQIGMCCF